MPIGEPTTTALFLLACGALLGLSAIASRLATRTGVPLALLFLIIGMLAGSDGLLGISFDDFGATFRIGTVALVLILFDGGLNTSMSAIRRSLLPASLLASVGVILTALGVAVVARLLGLSWGEGLLLGAVVSSTDAAAVFSVLRGSGLSLRKRTATTLELESGVNDPMAVILTMACAAALLEDRSLGFELLGQILVQLSVGLAAGIGLGHGCRWLLGRVRFISAGLYPVLTVSLAMLAFALPTLLWGSGFLAVYLAAAIIGNNHVPHSVALRRVHDALAWFSQVSLFLLMGLLATPSRLIDVAGTGLLVALALALVVRPLAVALCLLPLRTGLRDTGYIGWVGLRGAVPILLATIPVMQGVPGAERIFDIVFFIVVVNALLPGMSVGWLTKRLRLQSGAPPPSQAVLEIDALHHLNKDVRSFFIREESPVAETRITDIPWPDDCSALVVVRGADLITPRGRTVLLAGDHVYLLCTDADREMLQLMFGDPEEG